MNLRDDSVIAAIGALERRAERQESEFSLYNTYVDGGVLSEFSESESQIIYGRRGVGKTHLLHFHRHKIGLSNPNARYFVFDCQKLGSGTATISGDPEIVGRNYAIEFFNDFATRLFDCIPSLKLSSALSGKAQEAVLAFLDHIQSPDGSFNYRNLASTLGAFLGHTGIDRLYVALDEFVSVPQAAQPYFAHFLRLVFASDRRIVIKIAAVTFQTTLSTHKGSSQIGLEIGADIFGDIDLDSYFLLDENPDAVSGFFTQVLFNHLAEALHWDMGADPVTKRKIVTSFFFTQEKCAQELVRASEGNCRDLLNIFRTAYSEFRRTTASKIGVEHVGAASRTWFRSAKLSNLSTQTRDEEFLNFVIQHVIKERKSRYFMVSYQHARHPLLVRLLNLRLFHRMRTSWSHPDRPGEPYHIFIIDYGCYADLKGTRSEPHQQIFFDGIGEQEHSDDLVPLPDRRSIRRIVVRNEDLDKFYVKQ